MLALIYTHSSNANIVVSFINIFGWHAHHWAEPSSQTDDI